MNLPSLASSRSFALPHRSSMILLLSAALRSCSFFSSSAAFFLKSNWKSIHVTINTKQFVKTNWDRVCNFTSWIFIFNVQLIVQDRLFILIVYLFVLFWYNYYLENTLSYTNKMCVHWNTKKPYTLCDVMDEKPSILMWYFYGLKWKIFEIFIFPVTYSIVPEIRRYFFK